MVRNETTESSAANGTATHLWSLAEANAAGAECLAAALLYRQRFGWAPTACCDPNHVGVGPGHGKKCKEKNWGKAPMHCWGGAAATMPSEADVRSWWRSWPTANCGSVLGPVSGIVRADADGEAGGKRLRELCGGEVPVTVSFTSGQPHSLGLLFATPAGVELQSRAESFVVGGHSELRLQGRGMQTVLPPSRHRLGTRYRWLPRRGPDDVALAPMPQWMIDIMRVVARKGGACETADGIDLDDVVTALTAMKWLKKERADDRDIWIKVGMALHSVDDGGVLLAAWDKWSRESDKFVEGECAEKWAGFDGEREERVTLGSLIHWAEEDGWERPKIEFTVGGAKGGAWAPAVPLAVVPTAPTFPVKVLPEKVRRFVEEGAAAMPCPADYFAVPLLVVAGGLVGASRALAIKPGHVQRPSLYAAVIGDPGSTKTPSLEAVVDPVHEFEERIHADWEEAMKKYDLDMKKNEADAKDARKNNIPPPDKPARPKLKRLTVDDATAESLAPILNENPRGVIMVADELIGWVQRMNCYKEGGKGADRQFWLSVWSGKTTTVDRKKTHELGPVRVRKPFVGVIGGLAPDKLPTLRGDGRRKVERDGFLDRLLLSYPKEPAAVEENWANISAEASGQLGEVFARLRTLEMVPVQDGMKVTGHRPYLVTLSPGAKAVWQRFTARLAAERNAEDFPQQLAGPWAKFRGYCGRLALVIHFLRWACGEIPNDLRPVDAESMKRGAALVEYFKGHARKVYAVIDADHTVSDARHVLKWLQAHPEPAVFSRSDVYEGLRRHTHFPTPDSLDEPLKLLQDHGYIRAVAPDGTRRPGRPAGEKYERNPLGTRPKYPGNPQNPGGWADQGEGYEDISDISNIPPEESITTPFDDGPELF
jgi:hypothetical protein